VSAQVDVSTAALILARRPIGSVTFTKTNVVTLLREKAPPGSSGGSLGGHSTMAVSRIIATRSTGGCVGKHPEIQIQIHIQNILVTQVKPATSC
jgi:hypothetical protein